MEGFKPRQEPQMSLGFDAETFFANLIPADTKEISGSQMIDLFKKGTEAGFTNQDLQDYLNRHGIKTVGNSAPEEPDRIEYKTYGTGYDGPQPKR